MIGIMGFIFLIITVPLMYCLIESLKSMGADSRRIYSSAIILSCVAIASSIICFKKFDGSMIGYIYHLTTIWIGLLALVDFHYKELSLELLLASVVIGAVTVFVNPNILWYMQLLYGAITFVAMWLLSKLTRGSIGEGDGFVLTMIALGLGWQQAVLVLLFALLLTGLVALVLLIFKLVGKKAVIPFIPFMAVVQMALLFI